MIFEVYPAGIFQANCYIIGDNDTREGAVIDPGGEPNDILEECKRLGIDIKYILLTHGHGDHVAGVYKIKEETGAKILMHHEDKYLTDGATIDLIPILRNIRLFDADEFIKDGDRIKIGNIEVEVIETPGHTPGSVSFKIGDMVVTGDALFQGSVGRTDFPKGSHEQLINSIKEKIITLPDNTKVYPGHGPSTTVGDEKKYNPFL